MHVKSVELTRFKSFGGTVKVPLLPGFTVISGPNGSGKSNILDSLLFCLGLASSKGMRAERLPDLVNSNQMGRRSTVEAIVTATFDISDVPPELLIGEDEKEKEPVIEQAADTAVDVEAVAVTEPMLAGPVSNGPNGTGSNGTGQNGSPSNIVPLPREWSVTRRLRVTPQGTYTSNYYIDGQPCTLTELHEQLQRFRIYPEGYNVVLQGDVTSIISMNSRERRGIIDELAGVASFDRKIDQAKDKLEVVREREERFRIVEQELMDQLERLDQDRKKAEKYKQLKATLQEKSQWEAVMVWQQQQRQVDTITAQITQGQQQSEQLTAQMGTLHTALQETSELLTELNAKVKALGEDEHLALQSKLATQEAELRQLVRQEQQLSTETRTLAEQLQTTQHSLQTRGSDLKILSDQLQALTTEALVRLAAVRDKAAQALEDKREAVSAIATASQASVQAQTDLRHQLEALLSALEPQRAERVRLQERISQLTSQLTSQRQAVENLETEFSASQKVFERHTGQTAAQGHIQTLAQAVADAEQTLRTQRETQTRLLTEQREKQRELDKLEAQAQAIQETQGTQATEVLVRSGLKGICGAVAQLGRVDKKYQTALEIAAGGRLGYLVVDHDKVAAQGIDILKRKRAGRATFLPLNAIRVPHFKPVGKWERPDGFIDYAVNLIECDDRYQDVFAFVFGSTVVFETLGEARRHLGRFRMVTLEGEILESSGAMTGGSLRRQGRLHFGRVEPAESEDAKVLRLRLEDIQQMLTGCHQAMAQAEAALAQHTKALTEARQTHREGQLHAQQAEQQLTQLQQRLDRGRQQLTQAETEFKQSQARLQELEQALPDQETRVQALRQQLSAMEQSQAHTEWQQAQTQVRTLETQLSERQTALQNAQQQQKDLERQQSQLQEGIQTGQQQVEHIRQQQQTKINQQADLAKQQATLKGEIVQTQGALAELDKTLAGEKTERDRKEHELREQRHQYQQLEWQQQKLQETQRQRHQQRTDLQAQIDETRSELPDPLPEIPEELTLEKLKQQLRSLQKRLEAMEPVNMLALEEYERTQERLQELTDKLTTLEGERTELLLRVENFTTLRRQAFQEAFDAVNKNFQSIFAELSDGDGHLQLDDPNDPFNGGLNLVAHPKGKAVRRLASMSGGEKSLTALSFIFALQRYRPSPFYAFDEVDMFLDGANVERLSKMIQHQAKQAQFIVVSLRRPMIEAAERTIGVTQARGAYTQVLGIDLSRQGSNQGTPVSAAAK
ncbi:MAG: chromosome segregation protein SMC [Cyanobacteria bacterium P01_A01_bin.105]